MKVRAVTSGRIHVIDENRDLIRAGGEGGVYHLRKDPLRVAKVYHEPAGRQPKLEAMLRNPPVDDATPDHKSIAWPTELIVEAGSGRFLGFIMPKVERASGFHEFSNPSRRQKQHPNFTFRDLHIVASNAASAVCALHQKGYVIGDVNEGNLLIRDDALATVVDTDSFQVRAPDGTVYRCKVGREEFTPPELQSAKSLGDFDREVQHDLFGLGVLLFQLLMQGFHPYSGSPTSKGEPWSLGRRIAEGNFPWDGSTRPFKMPALAPPFDIIDPRLQRLFSNTFTRSGTRPSARTWRRELSGAVENLGTCSADKSHFYGKHLQSCPWCERDEQLAQTPVKSTPAVSVSAPSLSHPSKVSLPSLKSWRPAPKLRLPTLPPAPVVPMPEITAGTWRLHPTDPMVQLLSAFGSSDQVYELDWDGSCSVRGNITIMGNSCDFTAQGRWAYHIFNKQFSLDGTMQIAAMNFREPWMNFLARAVPPQPLVARMTVVDSGPDCVTLRDNNNGSNFLFTRLSGRRGVL